MHDNYDQDLLMELVRDRKFRQLRESLVEMNEVDIAGFLDELDVEQEILVFRLLPKDTAAEVFAYLEEDQERSLDHGQVTRKSGKVEGYVQTAGWEKAITAGVYEPEEALRLITIFEPDD